jgi:nitrous oxide reductase accessory protein NosL
MDLAELVYESVKGLPSSAAQEVLDFARFLAQSEASKEDRDLPLAQQSALADWDNPDDDAWNDAPAV